PASQRAPATHLPAPASMWGYQAAANGARMDLFDIGTHTWLSSCLPPGSGNGRGVAYDPIDGNLWYSFQGPATNYLGDGLIHKMTPVCGGAGSIPFVDGEKGSVQDDIGAIDVDPDDGNLWVAGYRPISSRGSSYQYLYKINRSTGAIVLNSLNQQQYCRLPHAGVPSGNDTLAVAYLGSPLP